MTASLDTREIALWRALTLMGRRLVAGLDQALQAGPGISVPDLDILMALDEADGGRVRAGALGEMLGWEKSRISHHVTRMESRELVRRVECSEDLRGTWVDLGARGRESLAAALPVFAAHVRAHLVAALPPEDAEALGRSALRILAAVPTTSCATEIHRLEGELS